MHLDAKYRRAPIHQASTSYAAAAVPAPRPAPSAEPGRLRSLFTCCLPRPRQAAAGPTHPPARSATEAAASTAARPLRLRVVELASAPDAVTQEVTRKVTGLVRARRFEEAGRVFAQAALGRGSTPQRCCALLQWLDRMWGAEGGFEELHLEQARTGPIQPTADPESAFGRAGAELLTPRGRGREASLEAVARFAQAYEQPGFPRLQALDGPGCGFSHSVAPGGARGIVRWWIGSLLVQLPTQRYKMADWHCPDRPSHAPLLSLLQYCGGHSVPAAMLCLWASSFGWRDDSPRRHVEPPYLNPGEEGYLGEQTRMLEEHAQSWASRGLSHLPFQEAVFCLAAGLADSHRVFTEVGKVRREMHRLLLVAFPDIPAYDRRRPDLGMPNILNQRKGVAGMPPYLAPYPTLAAPGEASQKQDRVSAWFEHAISLIEPSEFADQRQRVFRMLAERESAAVAAAATRPTALGRESKAGASVAAVTSLDDLEADDALIDRHTALPMLYASYDAALKPFLQMIQALERGENRGHRLGPERHLVRALATPSLRRHAELVANEPRWLSTWRDGPLAKALGAGAVEVVLRQLEDQLRRALGETGAPAAASPVRRAVAPAASPALASVAGASGQSGGARASQAFDGPGVSAPEPSVRTPPSLAEPYSTRRDPFEAPHEADDAPGAEATPGSGKGLASPARR